MATYLLWQTLREKKKNQNKTNKKTLKWMEHYSHILSLCDSDLLPSEFNDRNINKLKMSNGVKDSTGQ